MAFILGALLEIGCLMDHTLLFFSSITAVKDDAYKPAYRFHVPLEYNRF